MRWRKLGNVFCAAGEHPWMLTHAANPVAERRHGDVFRVYFSARDAQRRAHIGYVDIDLSAPQKILSLSDAPVIAPGETGLFDDSGTSMGCLVHHDGKRYLYYLGWNLGVTVPWRNSIGLAVSEGPDSPFVKVSRAPVMDRSDTDPFSISYPWVLVDGNRWRMWYGSNLSWGTGTRQEEMSHLFKYAESDDGRNWRRDGTIALPFKDETEYAMSKPTVVRDADLYRMWYSYRGDAYRIGYADSPDGVSWTRRDELAGIGPSESGWDVDTVCYPCVFDHAGERFMLYNGSRYGDTGFGLAVLEK
ncbi:hypothetical protein [Paraburkholderia phenazinium]|uniref:Glycosyl hydrolase family 32 N-terminal domain-containing protein n=2 Tax=Paraburkholderia phenazinium TaxID=60549 RepID=A0A1G8HZF8_9BURK|nr:hypothetical protein [Paraburkholderia phenazinium]SDI11994.1 hypothetical protein SAMN05216466_117128 [Paraburkholderia phenazinium]